MNTLLGRRWDGAGVAALGAAGVGYASLVERNGFALRRFTVPVLPPGSRPLRVLQISDLHLVPRQRRRIEWVRGLAALEPDLVVNTGDNLAALDAVPGAARRWSRCSRSPGCSSWGRTTTTRRVRRTRPLPHPATRRRHRPGGSRCPSRTCAGLARRRLGRPRQRADHLTVAGAEVELVGTDDAHIRYDRYAAVAGPASTPPPR